MAELEAWGHFKIYILKIASLGLLREFYRGIGYYNGSGPAVGYLYSELALEVSFETALQNRKFPMSLALTSRVWANFGIFSYI